MKTYTSWQTLMFYAKNVGDAKKTGNEQQIKEAEQQLKEYEQLCLKSDKMILPYTTGDLF